MEAGRFRSFWEELRKCMGGVGEWSRRVTVKKQPAAAAAPEEEYVVLLHVTGTAEQEGGADGGKEASAPSVGGRLTVLGGVTGGDGSAGFWAADIDAKTLARFEGKIMEYDDARDFAREFADALNRQDTLQVVAAAAAGTGEATATVAVRLHFRERGETAGFTLDLVQAGLSPRLLPTLAPFLHFGRGGVGVQPSATTLLLQQQQQQMMHDGDKAAAGGADGRNGAAAAGARAAAAGAGKHGAAKRKGHEGKQSVWNPGRKVKKHNVGVPLKVLEESEGEGQRG